MNEIWKPVKGYEGIYEVSSEGRVRSVDREKLQRTVNGKTVAHKYRGRILKPRDNGHGYKGVFFQNEPEEKRKYRYVHRLVAEAFIRNPEHLPVINHLDYNTANNAASNLEWTTHKANVHYSLGHMRRPRRVFTNRSTGEKYIFRRDGKYRLAIRNSRIAFDRRFGTLQEAINKREAILAAEGYLREEVTR